MVAEVVTDDSFANIDGIYVVCLRNINNTDLMSLPVADYWIHVSLILSPISIRP